MTQTDYNYEADSSGQRISAYQANQFLRSMNPYANTTKQVYRKCGTSGW